MGFQGPFGKVRKISAIPGFKPRTAQPATSRCNCYQLSVFIHPITTSCDSGKYKKNCSQLLYKRKSYKYLTQVRAATLGLQMEWRPPSFSQDKLRLLRNIPITNERHLYFGRAYFRKKRKNEHFRKSHTNWGGKRLRWYKLGGGWGERG